MLYFPSTAYSTPINQQVMGPAEDSTNASMKVKSYSIPRLATDRSNWITWKQQTLSNLRSNKGIQRHLEGMAYAPPAIPEYPEGHTLFMDKVEDLEEIEEKWDMYNQQEATIKAQILTTIPESIAIELQDLATSKELWGALCNKHEKRLLTVVVDLWCRLYTLKCLDNLNVKAHIQSLNVMYQQLKGMGGDISDGRCSHFTTLILALLPESY